nr:efflux RND transporter permease subunit [Rhizobium leguminosarum]
MDVASRHRPGLFVAIMAGLVPILWRTGTGSEIMQRSAVPMIGCMVSSTLLTLVVIPAVYGLAKGWRLPVVSEADHAVSEDEGNCLDAAE